MKLQLEHRIALLEAPDSIPVQINQVDRQYRSRFFSFALTSNHSKFVYAGDLSQHKLISFTSSEIGQPPKYQQDNIGNGTQCRQNRKYVSIQIKTLPEISHENLKLGILKLRTHCNILCTMYLLDGMPFSSSGMFLVRKVQSRYMVLVLENQPVWHTVPPRPLHLIPNLSINYFV